MKTRDPIWLVAAIAVPAALLSAGWLWAGLRERAAIERERQALVQRQAHVINAAIEESFEALRARENERPFDHYNHFYSPPDVLSLADPVARSPLAERPTDARVLGHFQIDPGGAVTTPYTPADGREGRPELSRRVLDGLDADVLLALAARASGDRRLVEKNQKLDPTLRKAAANDAREAAVDTRPQGDNAEQAVELEQNVGNAYTVSLNQWSTKVARDIERAQNEERPADNVFKQQRAAPKLKARYVEPLATNDDAPQESSKKRRPTTVAAPEPAPGQLAPTSSEENGERIEQNEETVDYTSMAWERFGDELLLTRRVSHGGVTSVQVARLDRQALSATWIPELIARHVVAGPRPEIVLLPTGASCDLVVQAARQLPDVGLCFQAAGVLAAGVGGDGLLALQGGLLLILLATLLGAALLLLGAERRARRLADQQTSFVHAVSHELRTPLTTIRMNAEMLRDDLVAAERKPRFLGRMVAEAVRLSHLVENVLEIARLDAGRRRVQPTVDDLVRCIRATALQQEPFLKDRGVDLVIDLPEHPVPAIFDGQAVEQILINLLDNAAKYGRGEDGTASVTVRLEPAPGSVSIIVEDQGPGVPLSEREQVFERFARAQRDDDSHVVGTGLGLALVREMAIAQGGGVEILDTPRGCAVRVRVPAAPAAT